MADNPQRERNMKLPVIERGGRFFTKYDPNIALDIVERIADGELLSKITDKDAQPLTITKQTFLRWVATVPELSTAYSAAMQISAHSFEEKAIDKAERTALLPGSPQNVSAASLLISQYRWSAARRNPTRYSDKGNTQIVVPININTTLDLGTQRQTADVEVPNIYAFNFQEKVEEAEYHELETTNTNEDRYTGNSETSTSSMDDRRTQTSKEFRELLRPDIPVVGTSRQPILEAAKRKGGMPRGPRKRVLTPRIKK